VDLDARLSIDGPVPRLQADPDAIVAATSSSRARKSPELARVANDGMAEIVAQHPDRFPAFVASLAMNNVPEALREMDGRSASSAPKGIQIFTTSMGGRSTSPSSSPSSSAWRTSTTSRSGCTLRAPRKFAD